MSRYIRFDRGHWPKLANELRILLEQEEPKHFNSKVEQLAMPALISYKMLHLIYTSHKAMEMRGPTRFLMKGQGVQESDRLKEEGKENSQRATLEEDFFFQVRELVSFYHCCRNGIPLVSFDDRWIRVVKVEYLRVLKDYHQPG